ncbi:NAD(P)/FAD-dependent oxidoreductase [Pararhodobacter zhoushanensis]|uniref:FAD-binding oxidoreductase n=1 Tax=Pararhodobacter zhoushanensis TaxID=2479545 RepID=A0ABT3GWP8_9RHOB|nr:FAD-dependent oxidoreductase [Pararhodobacter zhoushanensis]MCW1931933.1 FAD-binding oxidoreductase [Pararhodobacter zhoushanensis]
MTTLGKLSFWYADIGLPTERRAPLPGDSDCDVAIIGAGYTGLWAAYYLKQQDPGLRVTVLEKHFAGYGASGRNGGWLSGGFAWNQERYAQTSSPEAVRRMVEAMMGTVDEVIRVAEHEGIDADIRRCDELMVATNPAQLERLRAEAAHKARWGEGERVFELDAEATRARINIPGALGAMGISGVARIQPAKLVRGLAQAVERLGVTIHEATEVTGIAKGAVSTTRGTVRAPILLRCTEGFTATLPGLSREWLPMNSAQIVTEPLSPEIWAQIGWDGHEILGDFDHTYCYCQRTREGRITVGARGIPYRFGSAIDRDGTPDAETVRRLTAILHRHFPAARQARIDHAWCGVLGVPRDWCATVGLGGDGIGWAGGYVGVGVSTSNLAGRTLAALALGSGGSLTTLPWVNRRPKAWEPEPLRWLGVRAMYRLYTMADRAEAAGSPPSRLAALGNRLTGRG